MKNKNLIVILTILIGVMLIAGILYSRLGRQLQPQGLVTATTEAATEAATEAVTEAATEAATEAPAETEETPPPETVPAVDFTVLDRDGKEVKLSDYFGKPIVLNFWAYWCGPCQMEMPEFNRVYEELGGEVVFLMVHADPNTDQGKAMVEENGYTFPVVYDEMGQAAATYGITAFPTTFFLDAQGNVQAYYVGAMSGELLQTGVDIIYTP